MDFYCERTNLQFFDEPINILSNIFFFIAAYYVFKEFKKNKSAKTFLVFPTLIMFIGLGSASFHSLPNKITLLMDVLPIFLFSLLFVILFNFKIPNLKKELNFFFIIFFLLSYFILPEKFNYKFLNGSEFYLANDLILLIYIFLIRKKKELFKNLFSIFLIFNLSIFFRTIDNHICENIAIGSHFAWHFLNSIVLFKLSIIFKNLKYI